MQPLRSAVAISLIVALPFMGALAAPLKESKEETQATPIKSRTFLFTYAATVSKVPKGKSVKLWLPVPSASAHQDVEISEERVPGKSNVSDDPVYGNRFFFVDALPGADDTVAVSLTFKVTRREVRTTNVPQRPRANENVQRFLQADRLVPLEGKPLELIKDKALGPMEMDTGKTLYNVVNRHMKYSKEGVGWGNGDAVWSCDSKFGNCSDFHSLFISLARANKIPAKFEMGFPLPSKRGQGAIAGYHCWAWFLPEGKGWVPVDISEANRFPELSEYYFGNLCEDRVAFTTGRDIDLVPRQSGPPLNFFIYPYAEVDGRGLAPEQIQRSFSYKDER